MKTQWEKLAEVKFYTEGPALDGENNLYFSTMLGGAILRMDPQGRITEWARLRCPNGQRILKNGHHLVCDTQDRSVVELDPDGRFVGYRVRQKCAGRSFASPNDLALDGKGGFYFTDSTRHTGQVFYIDAAGKEKLVADQMDYPNGIVLSPDESKIYVAESTQNRIVVAPLAKPGVLESPFEVFVHLPRNTLPEDPDRLPYTANLPDGLACDSESRIWVAHYGMGALQVIGPDGDLLGTVPTGIPATSNLVFNPDENTVYVTGGMAEPGPGCVHKIFIDYN